MDLDHFLLPLDLTFETTCRLAIDFSHVFSHLALNSKDQFLATPVKLPRGTERGKFLAIDCGGSNLRVCWIELLNDGHDHLQRIRRTHEQSWPIEEHLKADKAEDLFCWIGDCIAEVVANRTTDDIKRGETVQEEVPVGITFSFPMIQKSIDEATLMPMGKGFAITSNLNLGRLLLDGYQRHTKREVAPNGSRNSQRLPSITIAAITNDTVATLASLAFSAKAIPNARVAMGLIMGTGTNASIPMRLKDLHKDKQFSINVPGNENTNDATIVVNTEWTIKGSAPPLRDLNIITKWDEELDSQCGAPGFQPFEYMTAGRYLGELVRLILYDLLVNVRRLEPKLLPDALRTRNAISTAFLSTVIAKAQCASDLQPLLERRFPPPAKNDWNWNEEVTAAFMAIARKVQIRSAHLVAAACIGLLACVNEVTWKTNEPRPNSSRGQGQDPEQLIIAYTGGTISQYPMYLETCQDMVDRLVSELTQTDKVRRVRLHEAKDGGVIGAGVLAGTAWHLPSAEG